MCHHAQWCIPTLHIETTVRLVAIILLAHQVQAGLVLQTVVVLFHQVPAVVRSHHLRVHLPLVAHHAVVDSAAAVAAVLSALVVAVVAAVSENNTKIKSGALLRLKFISQFNKSVFGCRCFCRKAKSGAVNTL